MDPVINLIRRCKNNDQEAFNDLLARHEHYLYQFCYGLTRDRDEALDIMQETYIKIFRSVHRFDESRPFLPWLKKIAINTFLNYRRDNEEGRPLSLGAQTDDFPELKETLAGKENTEEAALAGSTREAIDKLLKELPPGYRAALSLRYLDGMSYEEIANALDQPLGTVKNSIFRARNILRKKWKVTGFWRCSSCPAIFLNGFHHILMMNFPHWKRFFWVNILLPARNAEKVLTSLRFLIGISKNSFAKPK